ncbi:hypothetical protein T4B_12688 [Trichinella pseudospiralis]|nr:hypothetical protein T4B_12688 [Trichinella pseudospiralis]
MASSLIHLVEYPMITLFSYALNLHMNCDAWTSSKGRSRHDLKAIEADSVCDVTNRQSKFALQDEIEHLLEPQKILRISVKSMKLLITL